MNKLFKLIYVNLLNLFDINKIIIARNDGVKSNLEKRTIITGLMSIVYAVIIYAVISSLKITNQFLILSMGFFISTLICFFINLFTIEPVIFKNEDNDILFSLPVTRHQILFSKLFNVYLTNMFYVIVIMMSCLLSYYFNIKELTDTQVLMYVLIMFIVPFIPMVLATIVAYINDYFKLKNNNNLKYKFIKYILIMFVVIGIFMIFKNINTETFSNALEDINSKLIFLYPLVNMVYIAVKSENLLCFALVIGISILAMYIYTLIISNNYLRVCSMLKGIRKKEIFKYKKYNNYGRLFGLFRKELVYLFNNKGYFFNSFGVPIIGTIILFIVLNLIDLNKLNSIEYIDIYISMYVPAILGALISLGCSTISSMSLEKENIQIIRTLPVGIGKILFSKWLVNVVIGSVLVIINAFISIYYLKLGLWDILFVFLVPLFSLMFVSLTGLLLDYRFIEKNENNDSVIMKQRLITLVPTFIAIVMGISIMLFPVFIDVRIAMGSYLVTFIVFSIIEIVYLFLKRKTLLRNLIN
mgnify:FL=1